MEGDFSVGIVLALLCEAALLHTIGDKRGSSKRVDIILK